MGYRLLVKVGRRWFVGKNVYSTYEMAQAKRRFLMGLKKNQQIRIVDELGGELNDK